MCPGCRALCTRLRPCARPLPTTSAPRGGAARTHRVRVGVVELNGGEDGVVKALVHAHHAERDVVRLVRLERRADGQVGGVVAVEHVDELLLLDARNHARPALGVHRDELAGHQPAAAALAKELLVHLFEGGLVLVPLQHHDAARVGADDEVVGLGARDAEGRDGADGAEHVAGPDHDELAHLVGPQQLQHLAVRHHDLLGLGAREVAVAGALRTGQRARAGGGARRHVDVLAAPSPTRPLCVHWHPRPHPASAAAACRSAADQRRHAATTACASGPARPAG